MTKIVRVKPAERVAANSTTTEPELGVTRSISLLPEAPDSL